MSLFPIDVINFNKEFKTEIETAINLANSIQHEFLYSLVKDQVYQKYNIINFENIDTDEFIPEANKIRALHKGYYPYVVFITESSIQDKSWSNLFGMTDTEIGFSVLTSHEIADIIIPRERMVSYFLYFLSRLTIKFILKDKYNHQSQSTNGCVFDFCKEKSDILKSMRPNAFCDKCRKTILNNDMSISEEQFNALDKILKYSGELLKNGLSTQKPRIFIGSSQEGLSIAKKLKEGFQHDSYCVDTWADGIFDKPSLTYIEILEDLIHQYDYGIFVFTPDDKVFSRGKESDIPRDNVIFEYGMFLGKHTRKRVFFLTPKGKNVKIMTDLLGVTSLTYDSENRNLTSAVGNACEQVRIIINRNLESGT